VGDLHVHWIVPEVVGLEVRDASDRWSPCVGDRREKKEKNEKEKGKRREGGVLRWAGFWWAGSVAWAWPSWAA
jgi:hypothetical protein